MFTESEQAWRAQNNSKPMIANFQNQELFHATGGNFFCPDAPGRNVATVYNAKTVIIDGGNYVAGGTVENAHKIALECERLAINAPRKPVRQPSHIHIATSQSSGIKTELPTMTGNFQNQRVFYANDGIFQCAFPADDSTPRSVANVNGTMTVRIDGGTYFSGGTLQQTSSFIRQSFTQKAEILHQRELSVCHAAGRYSEYPVMQPTHQASESNHPTRADHDQATRFLSLGPDAGAGLQASRPYMNSAREERVCPKPPDQYFGQNVTGARIEHKGSTTQILNGENVGHVRLYDPCPQSSSYRRHSRHRRICAQLCTARNAQLNMKDRLRTSWKPRARHETMSV